MRTACLSLLIVISQALHGTIQALEPEVLSRFQHQLGDSNPKVREAAMAELGKFVGTSPKKFRVLRGF